jgi:hypothetical protein
MRKPNINMQYYVAIGLALVLAGSTGYLTSNPTIRTLVAVAGGAIIALSLTVHLVRRFLVPPFIRAIARRRWRILYTSEDSKSYASDIYRTAAEHGGEIHATHILQQGVSPADDVAVQQLQGNVRNRLKLVRTFLVDDQGEERKWIKSFFELEKANPELEAEALLP